MKSTLALFALIFAFGMPASAALSFGYAGRDGANGRSGYDGNNGQRVTFVADGSARQFLLDGTDGSNADRGQDGYDATGCYHNQPEYDLVGAPGGDGGNGGVGGNGGDGGNLTVYFQNESQLRQIYVTAQGGQPGRGSYGARGGRGCYCTSYGWTVRKCHTEQGPNGHPIQVCRDYRYYCRNGSDGRYGSSGRDGRPGFTGSVSLIRSTGPLAPDVLSASVRITSIPGFQTVLEQNIFSRKSGALALLAPGSRVNDVYNSFDLREKYPVATKWTSARNPADFSGSVQLFVENRQPRITSGDGNFLIFDEQKSGDLTTFTVTDAAKESELQNVSMTIEGNLTNTLIRVRDGASMVQNLLRDSFQMKLARSAVIGWDTQFEGVIDPSYIQRQGGDIIIRIGQMHMEDKKTFNPGKKIRVFLDLSRQFGPYSTASHMEILKHKLP